MAAQYREVAYLYIIRISIQTVSFFYKIKLFMGLRVPLIALRYKLL